MKTATTIFLEPINLHEMQNLRLQVNETLDIQGKKEDHKVFNSVDLWNIQRNRKDNGTRRFYQ